MDRPELMSTDRFAVYTKSFLADRIVDAQEVWAADSCARYNHMGIISSANEETFEALWTYRFNHLSAYFNCPVIIFRDETFALSWREKHLLGLTVKYQNKRYPVRQILAHIFPPFARSSMAPPVCSELVALLEHNIGEVNYWKGVNPDSKVDEWRIRAKGNPKATILYEGLWLWDDIRFS